MAISKSIFYYDTKDSVIITRYKVFSTIYTLFEFSVAIPNLLKSVFDNSIFYSTSLGFQSLKAGF